MKPYTTGEGDTITLPATLAGPNDMVLEFTEYDFHGITRLPRAVALGEFGDLRFQLAAEGQTWDPKVFNHVPKPKPEAKGEGKLKPEGKGEGKLKPEGKGEGK